MVGVPNDFSSLPYCNIRNACDIHARYLEASVLLVWMLVSGEDSEMVQQIENTRFGGLKLVVLNLFGKSFQSLTHDSTHHTFLIFCITVAQDKLHLQKGISNQGKF